jgi:hypothetical protein
LPASSSRGGHGLKKQEKNMTTLITIQELDLLSERDLRELYARILDDLSRAGQTPEDCRLAWLTLANIRLVLARRRCAPQP